MKLTETQLKQIIREETHAVLEVLEQGDILQRVLGVLQRSTSNPSPAAAQQAVKLAIELIRGEPARGSAPGAAGL